VHAYCLMTNHVHLLFTPLAGEDACAALMKNLSQHYVQHVNRIHGRTGTLWEGRYRSCVAASEAYVLACYRYIELNPVRAGIVAHPHEYLWSSYRGNAEGRADSLLVPHAAFQGLGDGGARCRDAYRSLLESTLEPAVVEEIRSATRGNRPLGATSKRRGRPEKMGSVPIF
ncbi:MAG: transposase, partial [Dongiaceae bacterium]